MWAASSGVSLLLCIAVVVAALSSSNRPSPTSLAADYPSMEREIKELGQKEANEMSKRADALENALKAAEKNPTAAKQLSWKMAKEAYEKAAFHDIQDMNTNTEGVNISAIEDAAFKQVQEHASTLLGLKEVHQLQGDAKAAEAKRSAAEKRALASYKKDSSQLARLETEQRSADHKQLIAERQAAMQRDEGHLAAERERTTLSRETYEALEDAGRKQDAARQAAEKAAVALEAKRLVQERDIDAHTAPAPASASSGQTRGATQKMSNVASGAHGTDAEARAVGALEQAEQEQAARDAAFHREVARERQMSAQEAHAAAATRKP